MSGRDICKCGDAREHHLNGKGRCLLGSLCTPRQCTEFRLHMTEGEAAVAEAAFRLATRKRTPT